LNRPCSGRSIQPTHGGIVGIHLRSTTIWRNSSLSSLGLMGLSTYIWWLLSFP
jgi:hypothetical protein